MKVVLAVTTSEGSETIADMLKERGFRVTMMSSMGGFLRQKNTTLMVGVNDEDVDKVLAIIKENAPAPPVVRRLFGRSVQPTSSTAVFVLDADRFERFRP